MLALYLFAFFIFTIDSIENCLCSVEELLNERMNVSIYYKTPTILLDNVAAIIF